MGYTVLVDGSNLEQNTPGLVVVGEGTLVFDLEGLLLTVDTPILQIDFAGGARAGQGIRWDFGTDIVSGGEGLGTTLKRTEAGALWEPPSQNGFAAGEVATVEIGSNGEVAVFFDNGQTLVTGRVALARFAREKLLMELRSGVVGATLNSGHPQIAEVGAPGRGALTLPDALPPPEPPPLVVPAFTSSDLSAGRGALPICCA